MHTSSRTPTTGCDLSILSPDRARRQATLPESTTDSNTRRSSASKSRFGSQAQQNARYSRRQLAICIIGEPIDEAGRWALASGDQALGRDEIMSDPQLTPGSDQQALVGLTVLRDLPTVNLLLERLRGVIQQALAEELNKMGIGRAGENTVPPAPGLTTAAVAGGVELSPQTKAKTAEQRGAAGPAKMPADDGGLIDMKNLARLVGVGQRMTWRRLSKGVVPKSMSITGKVTRWRADEIRAWIESGCPPQDEWEQMRESRFSDWPLLKKRAASRQYGSV
jgi:predicted DNA-binding transcriptional regulator AlpA